MDTVEGVVELEAVYVAVDVKLLATVDCWLEDVGTFWYEDVEVSALVAEAELLGNKLEDDAWEPCVLRMAVVGVMRVAVEVERYTLELVPPWAVETSLLVAL